MPLPCLSTAVTDVSSAAGVQPAFTNAKSGDTIQIRGLSLGAGFRVPAGVTLHGCMGAQITDTIAFDGGTGTIEGFTVPGAIIANRTGTYMVRANRFVDGGSTNYGGVAALANESVVSANVTVTIEGNYFSLRQIGVQGITQYDTLVHTLHLTIRNNIFYGNVAGMRLDEEGLVGEIDADIRFNTFVSGGNHIELTSITPATTLFGDIFYLGAFAVISDSPYTVQYSYVYGVPATMGTKPESGSFMENIDPMFAAWANSDLHLLPGSPLIDAVPRGPDVPADDYFGCPRPVGGGAEPGAIENQQ